MPTITWGLIAEHPEKNLKVNRAPKTGEVLERNSDEPMKISQVVDHEGETWIILESGEEETFEEIKPIEVSDE